MVVLKCEFSSSLLQAQPLKISTKCHSSASPLNRPLNYNLEILAFLSSTER